MNFGSWKRCVRARMRYEKAECVHITVATAQALPDAIDTLAPGGRLAVISFHSLEDRIVKHAFLRATGRPTPDEEILLHGPSNFAFYDVLDSRKVADLVTRKPVVPEAEETEANARARSAKLRVLQKLQSKP